MASLYIDSHQQDVSVERHFSRISPAFPSVTRFGACPAPGSTSMFCFSLRAPSGSGFPKKNPPSATAPYQGRDFFFGASAESTSRPWERGTSRRFAQECPEGNPGKYKQEN
jgi:hypothetical protein